MKRPHVIVPYRSNRPLHSGFIPRPMSHIGEPLQRGRMGALGLAPRAGGAIQGAAVGQTVAGAGIAVAQGASVLATGAGIGSAAGPIGIAVGVLVGVLVGALSGKSNTASHIGSWDGALVRAVAALPATDGIGRQFPWNENSHGLGQAVEALLATGVWLAWDPALQSSYSVTAHWAMAFQEAARVVVTAMCSAPTGTLINVQITDSPGDTHVPPFQFSFQNPGITIGSMAIASRVIMGDGNLIYRMIKQTGESDAHASNAANNSAAQKVFALIADYVVAKCAPQAAVPVNPVPPVAHIIPVVSQTVTQNLISVPNLGAPNPSMLLPGRATIGTIPGLVAPTQTTIYPPFYFNGNYYPTSYAPPPVGATVLTQAQFDIAVASGRQMAQPVTVTGQTTQGSPVVPVDQTAALIQQLKDQGASQSAAFSAAIASLQANNVPITPQVQAQVQADVTGQTTQGIAPSMSHAGIAGLSNWAAIGIGVVAVGFALARPAKRSTGKRKY